MASAVPLPNGQTQFIDGDGAPYAAGSVAHYIPGGFASKATWQDPNEFAANPNPVILDGSGRATIFGDGQYRQILKDSLGNTIWDQITTALGSTTVAASVPVMVGDSGTGGAAGLVPAPPVGSAAAGEYLGANGSFDTLSVIVPAAPPANQAGLLFVPTRTMSGTSDSLTLTDSAGCIIYGNAGAGALTISSDANASWVAGVMTQVMIYNPPASGILTLTRDSGVSLTWPGNSSSSADRALAPNGQCLLTRTGISTWTVVGSGLS